MLSHIPNNAGPNKGVRGHSVERFSLLARPGPRLSRQISRLRRFVLDCAAFIWGFESL